MEIAYHIGAHSTDEDLLLSCLRDNADLLAAHQVLAPPGEVYRPVLRETVRRLQGAFSDAADEQAVLDLILAGSECRRLVMSSENFICIPRRIFDDRIFYGKIGEKARWLRNVFPSHEVSFHLGVRSPASLIPALFVRQNRTDFGAFLGGIDLVGLRWRSAVERLRDAVPDAEIHVWCNEDTPLMWPEILSTVAGLPPGAKLDGGDARLKEIMTQEGVERYQEYLGCHPAITIAQRRWAAISFLDRYRIETSMEESYDLPGWTQDRIDALDAAYDADMDTIADLSGVTVLRP